MVIRSTLGHVFHSGSHVSHLRRDMDDLARIDSDMPDVKPGSTIPNIHLALAFRAISARLPARAGVLWRLELPENLPAIRVDACDLRLVVCNLLRSAHESTAQGHITLGALPTATALHLWINDTGVGIPPEHRRLLSAMTVAEQPFHRATRFERRLRMVCECVRQCCGMITFSSPPGAGVTFHICLPLSQSSRNGRPLEKAPFRTLPDEADLPPQACLVTRQAVVYLRENYANEQLARRQVAARIAVCERYLTYVFRRDLGITPWQYLTRLRIEEAKTLLSNTNLAVTEIAFRVGFNDGAYFSRVFNRETGRSPSVFRQQVQRWTRTNSSPGNLAGRADSFLLCKTAA